MKRILLTLLSFFFLHLTQLMACDIEVKAQSKKEIYQPGEELIVVVQVTKSHRVCRLDINETTYEPDGLKILSATDWKETAPGVWERKMKLKVISNAAGKPALYVRRKCSRENSAGSLVLNSKPVGSSLK